MRLKPMFLLVGAGIVAWLLGAVAAMAGTSGATGGGSNKRFCTSAVARDYTRPFSKMPPARPLPQAGRLPFLPGSARLSRPERATFALGDPRDLLYDLSMDSGTVLSRRLDLKAIGRLTEVDSRGKPVRVIRTTGFKIDTRDPATVDSQKMSVELPSRVGFFLMTIDLARTDGPALGRYREYFRTVRPTLATELRLERDTVQIGDRLVFRLANVGTQSIAFGQPFQVEGLSERHWSPVDLPMGRSQRVRLGLGPGEAGKCQSFVIPDALHPDGTYRIVKDLLSPSRVIASDKFTVVP